MRILIAEDEYYARHALASSVRDWDSDADIRMADNGQTALEMLRLEPADILLLDIRMPRMDGLTLADSLMVGNVKPYIIIISGFSEFDYARHAIRAGVSEYLLKPVDPDMLWEALENACDAIERAKPTAPLQAEEQLHLALKVFAWMEGTGISCPEPLLTLSRKGCECQQLALLCDTYAPDKLTSLCEHIQTQISLSQVLPPFVRPCTPGRLDVLRVLPADCSSVESERGLQEISSNLPGGFRLVASSVHPLSDASIAFQQIEALLATRCLCQGTLLLPQSMAERVRYRTLISPQQVEDLAYQLTQGNVNEALDLLLPLLDNALSDATLSVCCIQDFLNQVCVLLNQARANNDPDAQDKACCSVQLRLEDIDSPAQLKDRLEKVVQATCALRNQEHTNRSEEIVSLICSFIDAHYGENISLKALASSTLYMNVSYLSRMFKASRGTSFRNYLTDVRMTKAAEMLHHRDASVTKVALKCGYTDVSHFIQLFRRRFGVTPNAYREHGRVDANPS